jgi:uncharacterized protein YjgD (DUF1641 family)
MNNEELILAKLENIETQMEPLLKSAKRLTELKEDIIPLSNHAVQIMIKELQDVEAGFELDDMFVLMKQMLRSTKSFIFALKQMESIIEFVKDLEPLLKSAVPQMISYLDDLEQRGVIRIIRAMTDVRAKVADAYSPDDIEQIGDGMVAMLGLAKKMSDPQAIAFLEKAAAIPASLDLSVSKKTGPFGLVSAGCNSDIKEGLGVLMELTKALGKLKDTGETAPEEALEAKSA